MLVLFEIIILRNCTAPPIISEPEHHGQAFKIDEEYLFLVMYSEELAKAVEAIGLSSDLVNEKIAEMLVEKLKSEATLNSAAQSVVDEIKRQCDDSYRPGEVKLRDDITLIVRVFNEDIKQILIEKSALHDSYYHLDNTNQSLISTINSSNENTNTSLVSTNEEQKQKIDLFDQNGHIKAYVDFAELHNIISNDSEIRAVFQQFEKELEELAKIETQKLL